MHILICMAGKIEQLVTIICSLQLSFNSKISSIFTIKVYIIYASDIKLIWMGWFYISICMTRLIVFPSYMCIDWTRMSELSKSPVLEHEYKQFNQETWCCWMNKLRRMDKRNQYIASRLGPRWSGYHKWNIACPQNS